jgi:hypothetical protein
MAERLRRPPRAARPRDRAAYAAASSCFSSAKMPAPTAKFTHILRVHAQQEHTHTHSTSTHARHSAKGQQQHKHKRERERDRREPRRVASAAAEGRNQSPPSPKKPKKWRRHQQQQHQHQQPPLPPPKTATSASTKPSQLARLSKRCAQRSRRPRSKGSRALCTRRTTRAAATSWARCIEAGADAKGLYPGGRCDPLALCIAYNNVSSLKALLKLGHPADRRI